VVEVSK
jgi:hypothetical protein